METIPVLWAIGNGGNFEYDGETENWENPAELPTKILQHKYPERAIIRILNTCFGFCNYCYLTARMLDKEASKARVGNDAEWQASLEYLRNTPQISDVLISGGEPLMLSNDQVRRILQDLSSIPSIKSIRLNTRVLTFNPFRIDRELISIFKEFKLTALESTCSPPKGIKSGSGCPFGLIR